MAALRAVGRQCGVRFEAPPREDQALSLKFFVEAVCRASRIRSRVVALRGEWWTADCGPLFAVRQRPEGSEEPLRPVALLQDAPGRYVVLEPGTGARQPVTPEVAATINPFAWTFYKPFPERPLGFFDVLGFVGAETRRDALMLAGLAGAGAVLGLIAPWATGKLFDTVIPNAERGNLFTYGAALVAAALSTAVFGLTQGVCMMRVNSKWDGGVQAALWDRLLRLPAPFFRDFTVGDLAARAGAVNAIRRTLGSATLTTVLNSLHGVLNLFLLFHYSSSLALAATGIVAALMVVYAVLLFLALRLRERLAELDGKISGLVFQLLGGVSKLRVTASERRGFAVWSRLYAESTHLTFKANSYDNVIAVFNSMIPVLSSAAVYWLVHGQLHPAGGAPPAAMSVGDFVAFTAAFTLFLSAGMSLSTTAFSVLNVIPTWRRARPILEARPEVESARPSSKPLSGGIQAHHLTFRYKPDGPKILDDVSFTVEPGEFVALVGPSGSGKSTVLRLLLGFETPEIGSIYYDGQDLSKFDAGSIRRQIGVVLQNGRLLAGDIFTNIVGNLPLTIDDAWAAAEAAGVADDIRAMPMGMFTVISEGASTLSGGQRQRIIIARALVRNPKKIFFDEATSALDNRTQEIVTQSLAKMRVSRVVIAHRLSTVRDADKIIVMAKGRIIQQGTFDQLMKEGGLFRELASRQVA
jgi:NHLM bacteriocin system ABC transporter ATP-binding protein